MPFLTQGKRALQNGLKAGLQGIWDTAGKKNAPIGSGRSFIRKLLYHTNTYCQEYFALFLKFF
jgi:hypothetical protein